MKDYVAELVRGAPTPTHGRNVAREYLQARLLGSFQRSGAMVPLAFHGGTALRFLHATHRYSEDLDFALEGETSPYDFRRYLQAVRADLVAEGYAVELRVNDRKVVHSAFVRFLGLPHELGLSPHPNEVLMVRVEVDTRPPAGAILETTVIRRHVLLHLQHHDRASLFAGKLHAILSRPYTKGRDVYDLLWYLSDPEWPEPNLKLLNNALRQTGWDRPYPSERNWREIIRERLLTLDWDRAAADVRPFLESSDVLDLLTRENVLRALRRKT